MIEHTPSSPQPNHTELTYEDIESGSLYTVTARTLSRGHQQPPLRTMRLLTVASDKEPLGALYDWRDNKTGDHRVAVHGVDTGERQGRYLPCEERIAAMLLHAALHGIACAEGEPDISARSIHPEQADLYADLGLQPEETVSMPGQRPDIHVHTGPLLNVRGIAARTLGQAGIILRRNDPAAPLSS